MGLDVRLPAVPQPKPDIAGYIVVCFVRASDQAQAIALARPDLAARADVQACEPVEEPKDGESLAGVYRRSSKVFYGSGK